VKPLLVIPATKEALIGIVLWDKQVITQVHSYIFVINTCPWLRLGLVLITDIILILGYNYNILHGHAVHVALTFTNNDDN